MLNEFLTSFTIIFLFISVIIQHFVIIKIRKQLTQEIHIHIIEVDEDDE